MNDFKNGITDYIEKEISILRKLNIDELNEAMNAIMNTYREGGTIYICGNGGSAATASHFVCDFNKGISDGHDRKFNMICLNDNTPILSAIANDISYEDVFVYQVQNKLTEKDLVIAVSGSGNSKNIVKILKYAREMGIATMGITGYNGGMAKELSDYHMHVPVDDMQITEDIHMIFNHMMYRIFTDYLNRVDK